MERKHSSFLLRCWWRNDDLERIEIEHIQSGRRQLASSVAGAVEWICAHENSGGEVAPYDSRDPPAARRPTTDSSDAH